MEPEDILLDNTITLTGASDTITLTSGGYSYPNVTTTPNTYSNISSPYTISSVLV